MFQFPGFAPALRQVTYLQYAGLPHSDTRGSNRVCRSPRIFAAYRVLLRLWEPRHPPYALVQLMCNLPNLLFVIGHYCPTTVLFNIFATCLAARHNVSRILYFPICQWTFPNLKIWWWANLKMNLQILKSINPQIRSWRISESNRWPPACKAGALASWANPPFEIQNCEFRMLNQWIPASRISFIILMNLKAKLFTF